MARVLLSNYCLDIVNVHVDIVIAFYFKANLRYFKKGEEVQAQVSNNIWNQADREESSNKTGEILYRVFLGVYFKKSACRMSSETRWGSIGIPQAKKQE